jgi:flavin reductase (DIM6/NTAB) family NADH-FMN oxidoreductase RutF
MVDAQTFKNVMSRWATGISIITTHNEGAWYGFTANSFASVSIDPLLVTFSMGKTLSVRTHVEQSGVIAINVLSQEQAEWGKIFAGMIQKEDRFAGIAATTSDLGCPLLPDTLGWLSCRVQRWIDVGASDLILAEVVDAGWSDGEPLLYFHRQWGRFEKLE